MKFRPIFALAALLSGPALACNNPQGCQPMPPYARPQVHVPTQNPRDYFPEPQREAKAPFNGGFMRDKASVRCYEMGGAVYCDER
jgi:hypothetical protein